MVIEMPQQSGEHNPQVAKDPLVMIDGRPVVDIWDHNIALFTRSDRIADLYEFCHRFHLIDRTNNLYHC